MRIWSHLVKKFLMENFIFGLVKCTLFLFPLFISFFFNEEHNKECLLTKVEQFFKCSFCVIYSQTFNNLICGISKLGLILNERDC